MATEHFSYVVLGGGNAAGYAAREFVGQGLKPGQLCILTAESVVSYERPALSKAFLALQGGPRLPGFHTCVGGGGERQTPEWYADKGISFRTSCPVAEADLAGKTLTLSSGGKISYDTLIIATGAAPTTLAQFKVPGAELPGVLYLRNEADGQALLTAMQHVKDAGGQAVVIGGGYIGLEVAAGIVSNGIPTTLVMPEDRVLARLFTPKLAAFYEQFYAAKGIAIVKGCSLVDIQGDAKVSGVGVKLADGSTRTLPADLVVPGLGARACTSLFTGQLAMEAGGIKVDSNFCTSVPGVYAIGDVAAFPLLCAGGALSRQEHVTLARASASHAVKAILGCAPGPFDYLPYFYSRVFSLSWQFWGSQGDKDTQVVHFGDFESAKFGAYWVSGGKVVGVFLEGATPDEAAAAKKLAQDTPAAPAEGLEALGISFAMSRM